MTALLASVMAAAGIATADPVPVLQEPSFDMIYEGVVIPDIPTNVRRLAIRRMLPPVVSKSSSHDFEEKRFIESQKGVAPHPYSEKTFRRWFTPKAGSKSDPTERARDLDWRGKFAQAWELLSCDNTPLGLALRAHYLYYGRPGVKELCGTNEPAFLLPGSREKALELCRRIVGGDCPANDEKFHLARGRAHLILSHDAADYAGCMKERAAAIEEFRLGGAEGVRWVGSLSRTPGDPGFEVSGEPFRTHDAEEAIVAVGEIGKTRGTDAMLRLARFYAVTNGVVSTNLSAAEFWTIRAAIRGSSRARYLLVDGGLSSALSKYRLAEYARIVPFGWGRRGPLHGEGMKGGPGYGLCGTFRDYETDDELERLMKPFGLEAHWFARNDPSPGDSGAKEILEMVDRAENPPTDKSYSPVSSRCLMREMPFLLYRPKSAVTSSVPLVVYLPGCGEQGTDLKLQFRQTAVIRKVTSPEFQAKHPCYLLVPMPPVWANVNMDYGYPASAHGHNSEFYNDLILAVAEKVSEKGAPVDPRRIYLHGLGSGGILAESSACDHPGRYAAVVMPYNFPHHADDIHPLRPGNWRIAHSKSMIARNAPDVRKMFLDKVEVFVRNVRALGGDAEFVLLDDPMEGCWWDPYWLDDAIWDWTFSKTAEGEME